MSVLDDNYIECFDKDFKFDAGWRICEAIQRVLHRKKGGSNFRTAEIHVENSFIEKLINVDLLNYCLVEEDIEQFPANGTKEGPLPDQIFHADRKVPCRRSRIFICEPFLLNLALGANYWHVVPIVQKKDNMFARQAARILEEMHGSIVLTYNWRREELVIEGKFTLDFHFVGCDALDEIAPYRQVNNDICGYDKRFFVKNGQLCKLMYCLDAYVPQAHSYDTVTKSHWVTCRHLRHDIYGIKMIDYDLALEDMPDGDEYLALYGSRNRICNRGVFQLLNSRCFVLTRDEFNAAVFTSPLTGLIFYRQLGFIPNIIIEECKSPVSKRLFKVLQKCGSSITIQRLYSELDATCNGYKIPDLKQMTVDWHIPLTPNESRELNRSVYVTHVIFSILRLLAVDVTLDLTRDLI